MGNTIATTSLWGDRLDEYDYTDYGVPIHSPVALDGRWIENMADIGDGVTSVTLIDAAGSRLAPNSLLGCEVRVARRDPSSLIPVFATGWVISQFGTTLKIRDPGHLVADAWNDSASGTGAAEARGCANIYDLRQGFLTGRIEGATDTTCTVPGPWYGEDCTYIDVAAAPFDAWMFTPSPSYLWPVEVVLGDGAARTTAKVIDVANPVANVGFQTLIVAGHHQTAQGAPGKWYWISGIGAERDACQSGEWDAAADQDSSGNFTEFTLPSEAYVSDFQVGWLLQPDINVPVYLPITSANNGTITVSGSYGSLAPSSSGTHFRIYAPPGVERTGPFYSGFEAGTLSRFTSASSSRNLFGGYRYESPLAGVRDDLWMAVQGRQSGKNFTGLHYTLHRHYDPHLMRFTSTDPAAAPFFNLYAYCQGNPSRFFDPDGLDINTNATGCRLSPEDEEYFARSAGRTAALMDAMNCFGLFDRTKAAMRDQKSFSEVAGTFSNEVATTDWRTVTTSHFYNGANTLSGGWMGEVLDAETVAGWTGANVNSREWRAGAASGSFAATTAAMLNPYSAMTVGLLTMTHGGYLAARIAAGDDSIDPFHANAEMFGGAAMFMGGYVRLPSGSKGPKWKGDLYETPNLSVRARVRQLRESMLPDAANRVTLGAGILEDAQGVRRMVIATSEKRPYLRAGVRRNPGETMVPIVGKLHAEKKITLHAWATRSKLVSVGATRPICGGCQDAILPTNASMATPLKRRRH